VACITTYQQLFRNHGVTVPLSVVVVWCWVELLALGRHLVAVLQSLSGRTENLSHGVFRVSTPR
jgi:hypothetical protein